MYWTQYKIIQIIYLTSLGAFFVGFLCDNFEFDKFSTT